MSFPALKETGMSVRPSRFSSRQVERALALVRQRGDRSDLRGIEGRFGHIEERGQVEETSEAFVILDDVEIRSRRQLAARRRSLEDLGDVGLKSTGVRGRSPPKVTVPVGHDHDSQRDLPLGRGSRRQGGMAVRRAGPSCFGVRGPRRLCC